MDTQKIQIDTGIEKLKLSYSETPSTSNTKTNILLIHGFLGNILVYQPIIDQLKNFANVTAIDIPGFGESDACKEYSLGYLSNIIGKFITQKSIDYPILLGHSMGGMISYTFASQNSNKIKAVITQGSPITSQTITKGAMKQIHFLQNFFTEENILNPSKIIESMVSSTKIIKIISDLLPKHPGYKPLCKITPKEIIEQSVKSINPYAISKMGKLFDPLDLTEEIKKIQTPTLAMVGKKDNAVIYSEIKKFKKINPQLTIKIFDSFIHQQIILKPKTVAKQVYSFISNF